jgi:thioredoxin-dependent peroxiredoxin
VAKTPEIGQVPPDFTLRGIELTGSEVSQSEYTLSQQRGQPIVLAF